ncbi:MAG: tetratricopeptide repeat protein [bacterium]|nr:tetratricopeptide repeat protein [bacterium]
MQTSLSLKQQAIAAAKQGDWEQAVACNKELLEQEPKNTLALNRLGVAFLQLQEVDKAKASFALALELDRTNLIAKKHLEAIKTKKPLKAPSFFAQEFIEEPGKTKIVELHRLAGKPALESLTVGQICEFKQKQRYISIEANGTYIGSLPEDISFRLSKLLQTGNTYHCSIHAVAPNHVDVYLKEIHRSGRNKDKHSFPVTRVSSAAGQETDEFVLLNEESPVEMTDHDGIDTGGDNDPEPKAFEDISDEEKVVTDTAL